MDQFIIQPYVWKWTTSTAVALQAQSNADLYQEDGRHRFGPNSDQLHVMSSVAGKLQDKRQNPEFRSKYTNAGGKKKTLQESTSTDFSLSSHVVKSQVNMDAVIRIN